MLAVEGRLLKVGLEVALVATGLEVVVLLATGLVVVALLATDLVVALLLAVALVVLPLPVLPLTPALLRPPLFCGAR